MGPNDQSHVMTATGQCVDAHSGDWRVISIAPMGMPANGVDCWMYWDHGCNKNNIDRLIAAEDLEKVHTYSTSDTCDAIYYLETKPSEVEHVIKSFWCVSVLFDVVLMVERGSPADGYPSKRHDSACRQEFSANSKGALGARHSKYKYTRCYRFHQSRSCPEHSSLVVVGPKVESSCCPTDTATFIVIPPKPMPCEGPQASRGAQEPLLLFLSRIHRLCSNRTLGPIARDRILLRRAEGKSLYSIHHSYLPTLAAWPDAVWTTSNCEGR